MNKQLPKSKSPRYQKSKQNDDNTSIDKLRQQMEQLRKQHELEKKYISDSLTNQIQKKIKDTLKQESDLILRNNTLEQQLTQEQNKTQQLMKMLQDRQRHLYDKEKEQMKLKIQKLENLVADQQKYNNIVGKPCKDNSSYIMMLDLVATLQRQIVAISKQKKLNISWLDYDVLDNLIYKQTDKCKFLNKLNKIIEHFFECLSEQVSSQVSPYKINPQTPLQNKKINQQQDSRDSESTPRKKYSTGSAKKVFQITQETQTQNMHTTTNKNIQTEVNSQMKDQGNQCLFRTKTSHFEQQFDTQGTQMANYVSQEFQSINNEQDNQQLEQLGELTKQIRLLEIDKQECLIQLDLANQKVEETELIIKNLNNEIQEDKKRCELEYYDMQQLENQNKKYKEELNEIKQNYEEIQKQVTGQKQENASLLDQQEISNIKQENVLLQTEINTLKQNIKQYEQQIEQLKQQVEQLNQQIEQLKQQNLTDQQISSNINKEFQVKLNNQNEEYQQQLDILNKQIKELQDIQQDYQNQRKSIVVTHIATQTISNELIVNLKSKPSKISEGNENSEDDESSEYDINNPIDSQVGDDQYEEMRNELIEKASQIKQLEQQLHSTIQQFEEANAKKGIFNFEVCVQSPTCNLESLLTNKWKIFYNDNEAEQKYSIGVLSPAKELIQDLLQSLFKPKEEIEIKKNEFYIKYYNKDFVENYRVDLNVKCFKHPHQLISQQMLESINYHSFWIEFIATYSNQIVYLAMNLEFEDKVLLKYLQTFNKPIIIYSFGEKVPDIEGFSITTKYKSELKFQIVKLPLNQAIIGMSFSEILASDLEWQANENSFFGQMQQQLAQVAVGNDDFFQMGMNDNFYELSVDCEQLEMKNLYKLPNLKREKSHNNEIKLTSNEQIENVNCIGQHVLMKVRNSIYVESFPKEVKLRSNDGTNIILDI